MAVLIFVVVWVIIAIGLVFIGLSGGPKGARQRLHSQSRPARKISFFGFGLAVLVLGFGIPAAVIAAVEGRDSVPESNIKSLTAQEELGRELFVERCRQCHTLQAAAAVAQVGPSLDTLRPTKGLVLDAIKNGRARGNGAMAADLVVGEDAEAVAAFVAKAVGQTDKTKPQPKPAGEDAG